VLVGRDEVTATLGAVLADAESGRSRTILLRGEAGIGKTTLLNDVVLRAEQSGFQILRARGISSESELGFACLADLFRSCETAIDNLPAPQAAAMRGALALGPPVSAGPFVVAASALSLLAALGCTAPVLVAVDDVQWVDAASFQALSFAARRLQADRVAIVLASRTPDDQAEVRSSPVGVDLFEGLETLSVRGLSIEAARELVDSRLGPKAPTSSVLAAMHRATGGNPLALLELPGSLTMDQLSGQLPLDDPLPVAPALHAAYALRLQRRSNSTRQALLIAAASADGELSSVLTAMAAIGLSIDALLEAEEHGLVVLSHERVDFVHPILRSAAYHVASAGERRSAHQSLALALDGDVARNAWHRAAATVGPDEGVAAALALAATASSQRGAHLTASRISQLAASRTPDADGRSIRYASAALSAHVGGAIDLAIAQLEQAQGCVQNAHIRHEIVEALAVFWMLDGRLTEATELAADYVVHVDVEDPARAARLCALASTSAFLAGDAPTAFLLADRAEFFSRSLSGEALAIAQVACANSQVIQGNSVEGSRLIDSAMPILESEKARRGVIEIAQHGAPLVLCWLERFDDARRLLDRCLDVAKRSGSPASYPFPLIVESELAFATGCWDESQLAALRAAELASQTGQRVHVSRALLLAARVDAGRGDGALCRSRMDEALRQLGTQRGAQLNAADLRGRLMFAEGDMHGAAGQLASTVEELVRQGCGDPAHTGPLAELVEALIRLDRRSEAIAPAHRWLAVAEHTQRAWALGSAHRCMGLLATSDLSMSDHFMQALEWHARSPNVFETARTQLCFGEQLRRRKRRADSRVHLRSAVLTFDRLGAVVWAERARSELGLTSERAASRSKGRTVELTTQERHVVDLVVDGEPNRTVASHLFISEKTVEYHLSSVYRKLGVRSRTQLASVIGSQRR
jgi:DNA-binding CsgD family transcriptional regulator